MQIFSITHSLKEEARLAYVVEILNSHPYCKSAGVAFTLSEDGHGVISYGLKNNNDYHIPCAASIFKNVKSTLNINPYKNKGELVYSVEEEKGDSGVFFEDGVFGFDIFETIFFHVSRYEELSLHFEQYLGRKYEFEKELLLVRSKLEKVAVVDDLVEVFLEVLTGRKTKIEATISLSHDIDFITKFKSPFSIFRKVLGHFRHRKSIKGFPYLWNSYLDFLLKGNDGFDTFEWMLSSQDIDKTIYFLVGGDHKEDNTYDLRGKTFKKALRIAKERNYHIGIHPSYESWDDIELIRQEKGKLENEVDEEIVRSRQHFLNFDINKTPELLQSLGIREDSSIGYTRHVGYRCGTGFSYKLYDFKNEKAFDVVEKPLVFMDVAWLFESLREGSSELPNLADYHGSFNFHNSTFDEMGARNIAMKEHYLKFFR
jgi:hypothetical protein